MEHFSFWNDCARSLLLLLVLARPGLAVGQTSTQAPVEAAGQEDDGFRVRVKTAAWLYEELEYEQALKALSKAKLLAKTENERAEVALYEGIVQADLGQRPRALTSFREALSLNLDARLPVKVSPKVERDFEAVRQELRSERDALARAKAPPPQALPAPKPPPTTTDRPANPATREPSLSAAPVPAPAETSPGVAMSAPRLREERSRGIRPLPLALLGTGVAAGGVGSYFGLRSQGNIQDARESTEPVAQVNHLDAARGQALAANILFGVAVTAAAGAVITYFAGNKNALAEDGAQ